MIVYRVALAKHARSAQEMLSGDGAMQWGGRWNSPGTPAVYCSQSLSLCALEILVHLPSRAMHRYHYIEITVPDEFVITIDNVPDEETDSRVVGDRLLRPDGELAFAVPSRVIPFEYNVILNPAHTHFEKLVFGDPHPFPIDERLLK